MILKLSRTKVFVIGITTIIIFLALNRLNYISGSEFTKGQVVSIKTWTEVTVYKDYENPLSTTNKTRFTAPIIKFSDGKNDITFQGETNMEIIPGETVNVLYKTATPENAEVFTFSGFLLSPLLYCLLPLILLAAAAFSFINANEIITIDTATLFKKKK